MWNRRVLPALCLALVAPAPSAGAQQAATPDSLLSRAITSTIDAAAPNERFSGVVLVARDGVPIVELARGHANRKTSVPNTMATRFQLASGDKWFAKIAISQLVAAGKVALSDTVGKFLPRYPGAVVRSKVTVEQLLLHRSGLGAYFNAAYMARREKLRTLDDVVALFAAEEPAFAPGERQQYSNSGYVLLGRIVEVASGLSWYDYVQQRIFRPAGMTGTAYLTLKEWPSDKAIGYTAMREPGATGPGATSGAAPAMDNTSTLAFRGSSAGQGYSTAGDLLRLDAALRRGALADTAVLSRVTSRAPGGRAIMANGGGPGANVEISRLGAYTIIVLANTDPPSATRVLTQIVALLQPNASSPGSAANGAARGRTPADVRAEVERLSASMVDAFQRGEPLAVAAHYTADARIIGPSGPAIEGRDAVQSYWKGFVSPGRTWKLDVLDVGGSADFVYQYGRSTLSSAMGSQSVLWVGVWRRQADGSLKLALDYWVPAR